MADAQGNRYGPYDIEVLGSESEALTEDAWFDLFDHISGVNSGGELTFNGLTANLSAIDARVHGSYLIRADPWSDASPATSTSAPRRDMLVARRQRTSGEGAGATPGKTFLTVLRGTPATTPAEPTTYDTANDEQLFSWQVPGNGGTVITGVRDLRRAADTTPRIIPSMAARPTTDRYLGTRVQPRDRPSVVYVWDGTRWVQEGLLAGVTSQAPAGSYVSRIEDTAVPKVTNAGGGFVFAIPFGGFSAVPLKAEMQAGDNAGGVVNIVPIGSNHTPTSLQGAALQGNGSAVGLNTDIRVNFVTVGYNT